MSDTKELPQNPEAEMGLIGAILVRNDSYKQVSEILKSEEVFYEVEHQRIWKVIATKIAAGETADRITVKSQLGPVPIGGMQPGEYLNLLVREAAVRDAVDYAKEIRACWIRRSIISICEKESARCYEMPIDATIEAVVADLDAAMEAVRPALGRATDYVSFDGALTEAIDAAAEAFKNGGRITGLSTGLDKLDRVLGGLQDSDLIVIAGRPSMGKTGIATNIILAVARALHLQQTQGQRPGIAAFASLEMPKKQIAQRILSDISGIPVFAMRNGTFAAADFEQMKNAEDELRGLPLHIDDTGGLSISALKTRARSLHKKHRLRLLVVDYLQLLTGSGKAGNNRTNEVTEITGGLKALAKELNIPVIALSQLSRDVEAREPPRPQMRDLRESGSIEQDADVVVLLYREEYYLKEKEPKAGTEAHTAWLSAMDRASGIADIIIPKNRNGGPTSIKFGFEAKNTRFVNEPPEKSPEPEKQTETRGKKAPAPLHPDSLRALGTLRGMCVTHYLAEAITDKIQEAPQGVRAVLYTAFRQKFCDEVLEPNYTEKKADAFMDKVMRPLVKPVEGDPYVRRVSGGDVGWIVWVTPRGKV